jgi:hypothetical protein
VAFDHRKITPLWPKANAQAEGFNKPLLKAIRAAYMEGWQWKEDTILEFLQAYRATPHSSTKFSPHYLMFGRHPLTLLPTLIGIQKAHPADQAARQNDAAAKATMKHYADKANAQPHDISRGDTVLVKDKRRGKIHPPFSPDPLVVTSTTGSMVTAKRTSGETITRNASLFRKLPDNAILEYPPSEDEEDSTDPPAIAEPIAADTAPTTAPAAPEPPAAAPLRPRRICKRPRRLIEEA